jgi:hypothetical protein
VPLPQLHPSRSYTVGRRLATAGIVAGRRGNAVVWKDERCGGLMEGRCTSSTSVHVEGVEVRTRTRDQALEEG